MFQSERIEGGKSMKDMRNEEKKPFETPEIRIILIRSADIITASGFPENGTLGEEIWTPWIDL